MISPLPPRPTMLATRSRLADLDDAIAHIDRTLAAIDRGELDRDQVLVAMVLAGHYLRHYRSLVAAGGATIIPFPQRTDRRIAK